MVIKKRFGSKVNSAIVFLLFFIIVLGCQPEGGELLPIDDGNIQISSSRFENDTAVVTDKNLKITLYGTWDGRAEVRVIVENNGGDDLKIDFNSSKVIGNNGEEIKIDSVYEDKGNSINQVKTGFFTVVAKEKRKLVIGFPANFSSITNENQRIISIVLAVETNTKTKEGRMYNVKFKGIGKKDKTGKPDPIV